MKQKTELPKKMIVTVAEVIVLCAVGVFAVAGNRGDRVQGLLDLGQSYLKDEKYEQAIAAFESVLEIDPKEVKSEESQKILENRTTVLAKIDDAYEVWADYEMEEKNFEHAIEFLDVGKEKYDDDRLNVKLADVYIAWASEEIEEEDYDRAEEILKEGKKKTGDKRFKKRLKQLHKLMYPNGKGASETVVVKGTVSEKLAVEHYEYIYDQGTKDWHWIYLFYYKIVFKKPISAKIDGEVVTTTKADFFYESGMDDVFLDEEGDLRNLTLKMRGFFEKCEDDDIPEDYDFTCLEILN